MRRHIDDQPPPSAEPDRRSLFGRISRLEWAVAALTVIVMAGLVVAEPDILEAPFENPRTIGFTVGGTVAAAIALALISPFFIDDVVNDDFATSIAVASGRPDPPENPPTTVAPTTVGPTVGPDPTAANEPASPALLGAGQFKGLAGHEGTGDAGIFRLADCSHVVRLENLDIQNGPDLRLYLVPGAGQTSRADGSQYLGGLRDNIGNQTYILAADFVPTVGHWTVLV